MALCKCLSAVLLLEVLLLAVLPDGGSCETQMETMLRESRERRSRGKVCIGGNDCCTPSSPCGVGEGDCDEDVDCMRGLACGARGNCKTWLVHLTDVHSATTLLESFSDSDSCCQPNRYIMDEYMEAYRAELVSEAVEREKGMESEMASLATRARRG